MAQRIEADSLGTIEVPADRYWGAQTQRSLENFQIGREQMPAEIIEALALVKLRSLSRLKVIWHQISRLAKRLCGSTLDISVLLKLKRFWVTQVRPWKCSVGSPK